MCIILRYEELIMDVRVNRHFIQLLGCILNIALAVLSMTLSHAGVLKGFGLNSALADTAPGGFVESATSTTVRSRVTPTLPTRGRFTFPPPYNTTGIRLTNASDCGGG